MKKTLKNIIEECLKEDETCRNSDKYLTVKVYRMILMAKYGNDTLSYARLDELPLGASIKRIRCMIQNDEKKFLPTEEKTAYHRRWNNKVWEERIGKDRLFPIPITTEAVDL